MPAGPAGPFAPRLQPKAIAHQTATASRRDGPCAGPDAAGEALEERGMGKHGTPTHREKSNENGKKQKTHTHLLCIMAVRSKSAAVPRSCWCWCAWPAAVLGRRLPGCEALLAVSRLAGVVVPDDVADVTVGTS